MSFSCSLCNSSIPWGHYNNRSCWRSYPFDTTVILTCSVTPPSLEGAIYSWTDSNPSTTLSSAQPNLTLTIPAHHPGQGHYYCTVSNGSTVLGVGSTTISVRSELDKQTMFGIVTSKSCLMKGLVNTIWVCSAMISCWQSLVVTDLTWFSLGATNWYKACLQSVGVTHPCKKYMHLICLQEYYRWC